MISQTVRDYSKSLDTIGVAHKVIEHPELKTPPEVQNHLGLTLTDGLATMIMKTGDGFIVAIRRCDTRLESKKLKKLVGNKLRIASAEEFTALTGLPLGTATAYNLNLPTYLDAKLFEKEYLTSGSGSFSASILVKTQHLKNIPGSQVVEISE